MISMNLKTRIAKRWQGPRKNGPAPYDPGKLDDRQRELAAQAFHDAGFVTRSFRSKFPRQPIDWDSEAALRICRMIGKYDPGRASLVTWARNQARCACLDALRKHGTKGQGRFARPKMISLDSIRCEDGDGIGRNLSDMLAAEAPCDLEGPPSIEEITRGLPDRHKFALVAPILRGMKFAEVGEALGVAKSTAHLMHKDAAAFARRRLTEGR